MNNYDLTNLNGLEHVESKMLSQKLLGLFWAF